MLDRGPQRDVAAGGIAADDHARRVDAQLRRVLLHPVQRRAGVGHRCEWRRAVAVVRAVVGRDADHPPPRRGLSPAGGVCRRAARPAATEKPYERRPPVRRAPAFGFEHVQPHLALRCRVIRVRLRARQRERRDLGRPRRHRGGPAGRGLRVNFPGGQGKNDGEPSPVAEGRGCRHTGCGPLQPSSSL